MSEALRVNIYTHNGSAAVVRGLPAVVLQRLRIPQRWDNEQHAWMFNALDVPDLCAILEHDGITPTVHEKAAPPWKPTLAAMTPEEAESATIEMISATGYIEKFRNRFHHVACDFIKRKGWIALGYTTLDEYAEARLPFRLPRDLRREFVLLLVEQGISNRAAAAITRTDEKTVRNDLATAEKSAVRSEPVQKTLGMDGRETRPRRTYQPVVEPDQVWTPTEDNVVQMPVRVTEPCVEATISLLETGWRPTDSTRLARLHHLIGLTLRGMEES